MATQLRTTLKGYFQTGNIPVEQHYIDFIDSTLNLSENNSGNIDLTGNITASGTLSLGSSISSSGNFITAGITSSGHISASGAVTASGINIFGNITASGDIKCGEIAIGGQLSATNVDFTYISGSKITLDDAIVATTLDTGQGANELYDMNQNVKTDSAVTFATVNTGQGANELYDMNQNVTTTSNVTFGSISLTKAGLSAGVYGGVINTEGQSFTITLTSIPDIPGKASLKISKSVPTAITNLTVTTNSVILATVATAELSINAFKVVNGSFLISLGNESNFDFTLGSAQINFTIF